MSETLVFGALFRTHVLAEALRPLHVFLHRDTEGKIGLYSRNIRRLFDP